MPSSTGVKLTVTSRQSHQRTGKLMSVWRSRAAGSFSQEALLALPLDTRKSFSGDCVGGTFSQIRPEFVWRSVSPAEKAMPGNRERLRQRSRIMAVAKMGTGIGLAGVRVDGYPVTAWSITFISG